jgi:hypothetical protein
MLLLPGVALAGPRGSGVLRTEAREIAAFHAIEAHGGAAITVRRGDRRSLTITGDDNLLTFYRTAVKDGTLVIEPTERGLAPSRRIAIAVTTPRLDALEASGGVAVTLEGALDTRLSLRLSGGVEVTAAALALETLDLNASGGVTARLGGQAKKATYDLSGGVDLKASRLESASVKVDASGGCSLEVWATQSIEGDASGGVEVRVWGSPARGRVATSGGASVDYVKG